MRPNRRTSSLQFSTMNYLHCSGKMSTWIKTLPAAAHFAWPNNINENSCTQLYRDYNLSKTMKNVVNFLEMKCKPKFFLSPHPWWFIAYFFPLAFCFHWIYAKLNCIHGTFSINWMADINNWFDDVAVKWSTIDHIADMIKWVHEATGTNKSGRKMDRHRNRRHTNSTRIIVKII